MDKRKVILVLIFFLGFFLRFVRLGDIPVGFHRDEAFLGYNAYSIASTGRDMNGNLFPLHLQSFLYSPAGYSYLSIPFIKIFDLNPFSVRFASALFGSLTILVTFFLCRSLFENYIYKDRLSLINSLVLALSPWHINLSKTATENTTVVFLISLGVLLFLRFIKKNRPIFLFLSFISLASTLLIYQAPRAFLPLFVPLLVLSFVKIKHSKRMFNMIILYTVLIMVPLFMILSSPDLSLRIRTLNIFNHPETQLTIDEASREDGISNMLVLTSRIFHNKINGYSSLFLKNYFEHFSFQFLFTDSGLPDRYRVPSSGLLYLIELPLVLFGVWFLLKNHKKIGLFLIGWVLIAPIGSALTFDDVPNLQRTMLIFPSLSMISAFGLLNLYFVFRRYIGSSLLIVILSLISIYSVLFYLHQYYVHQLVHRPWYRQEGYKELVKRVNELLPNYNKAIITNRESAPTIFFLFFSEYDPKKFQQETKGMFLEKSDSQSFYKYEFSDEECPIRDVAGKETLDIKSTGKKNILYVNDGNCRLPEVNAKPIGDIKRKDGTTIFYLLEAL